MLLLDIITDINEYLNDDTDNSEINNYLTSVNDFAF